MMTGATAIQDDRWTAFAERDSRYDGRFFVGVTSTGIYCRPSCPARRPKPENVRFFESWEEAEAAGLRACLRCRPREVSSAAQLVQRVAAYIDANPEGRITLEALSAAAKVSTFHLQRTFKNATGVSPRAYAEERRKARFQTSLREAPSVTDAIYEAGFGASSRAYERSGADLGMRPAEWKRHGEGAVIRFATASSEFGLLFVAATDRGVCAVRLGDDAQALEEEFRLDFDKAQIHRDDSLTGVIDQILVLIGGDAPHPEIPVDVRATAFQRRVWEHLRTIPRGETRSYSQLAAELGAPRATRAVARACATNEVALVVPCHRVVGADGSLTGYRWGIERKRKLLEVERGRKR